MRRMALTGPTFAFVGRRRPNRHRESALGPVAAGPPTGGQGAATAYAGKFAPGGVGVLLRSLSLAGR